MPVDAQSLSQLIDKLERDLPRSNTVRCMSLHLDEGSLILKDLGMATC